MSFSPAFCLLPLLLQTFLYKAARAVFPKANQTKPPPLTQPFLGSPFALGVSKVLPVPSLAFHCTLLPLWTPVTWAWAQGPGADLSAQGFLAAPVHLVNSYKSFSFKSIYTSSILTSNDYLWHTEALF